MFFVKIADLIIEIQNRYDYIKEQCKDYIYCGDTKPDFSVTVTDTEILAEKSNSGIEFSSGYLESICLYRKIALLLPQFDAFLMHGAVITFDGEGIIFLAKSGVGKSTHIYSWKKQFGKSVDIINGDKPIIRFTNGVPYAYGTPWAGKENWQKNTKTALKNVCFIERSMTNHTERINPADRLDSLIQQVLHPSNPATALKSLELVDMLTEKCNFWIVNCNPELEAAVTAHKAIILGE